MNLRKSIAIQGGRLNGPYTAFNAPSYMERRSNSRIVPATESENLGRDRILNGRIQVHSKEPTLASVRGRGPIGLGLALPTIPEPSRWAVGVWFDVEAFWKAIQPRNAVTDAARDCQKLTATPRPRPARLVAAKRQHPSRSGESVRCR